MCRLNEGSSRWWDLPGISAYVRSWCCEFHWNCTSFRVCFHICTWPIYSVKYGILMPCWAIGDGLMLGQCGPSPAYHTITKCLLGILKLPWNHNKMSQSSPWPPWFFARARRVKEASCIWWCIFQKSECQRCCTDPQNNKLSSFSQQTLCSPPDSRIISESANYAEPCWLRKCGCLHVRVRESVTQ